MLFRAADPPERYRILERFYRLPEPLIGRFYAGRSTAFDRLRILAGTAARAVGRAAAALMEKIVKSAIVIGSGFGGLALAIRLQSAGIATTIVEARDKPGGRAYFGSATASPSMPARPSSPIPTACSELWRLTGQDMADDVELVPVTPVLRAQLARRDALRLLATTTRACSRRSRALNPADVAGYTRFLDYSAGVYEEGYRQARHQGVPRASATCSRPPPLLAKYQAWRSVYSIVSKFVATMNICGRH